MEGTACWPANHPHLVGHFPGFGIVPGVFLIEAAAQLGGIALKATSRPADGGAWLGVLGAVRRALLHHPTYPDERIQYVLEVGPFSRGRMYRVAGTATGPGNEKVLTVDLAIAIVDINQMER